MNESFSKTLLRATAGRCSGGRGIQYTIKTSTSNNNARKGLGRVDRNARERRRVPRVHALYELVASDQQKFITTAHGTETPSVDRSVCSKLVVTPVGAVPYGHGL